jgi:MOSC domain-containing protein YiiM
MHDRGGSILRVIESGDIAVGDTWQELAPDDPPGKLGR